RRGRLDVPDFAETLLQAPRRAIPQELVARQTRAMRDQIAQRHLAVGKRIREVKERNVLAHRIVPAEPAFIDAHHHGGGGERLGAAGDWEDGVRRDGRLVAELADAEPFEVDEAIVLNDGHGGAGDVPGLEGVAHDGVDVRRRRLAYKRSGKGEPEG